LEPRHRYRSGKEKKQERKKKKQRPNRINCVQPVLARHGPALVQGEPGGKKEKKKKGGGRGDRPTDIGISSLAAHRAEIYKQMKGGREEKKKKKKKKGKKKGVRLNPAGSCFWALAFQAVSRGGGKRGNGEKKEGREKKKKKRKESVFPQTPRSTGGKERKEKTKGKKKKKKKESQSRRIRMMCPVAHLTAEGESEKKRGKKKGSHPHSSETACSGRVEKKGGQKGKKKKKWGEKSPTSRIWLSVALRSSAF